MKYKMLFGEKYRLELHWKKAVYEKDCKAILEGCYFSGPVLDQVLELNQKDSIRLDFVNQYRLFVESYYIADLFWKGVKHIPDKILLSKVVLENKYLNSVPKLMDNDYIVIDTSTHEDKNHFYNLVYMSYLLREDGTLYSFNK